MEDDMEGRGLRTVGGAESGREGRVCTMQLRME